MFKFSLSSKELFHSNFLEWLYNVDKDKDKFKNLIQKMAGLKNYDWPDNWMVKREYNNFDLCIVETNAKNNGEETDVEEGEIFEEAEEKARDRDNDNNNEDGNFRILFVIENKVKSIPYREQLIRYAKEANSINEAYWKSRGKDVLAKNGYKEDCIVVENSNWVLKRGKYREGRNVKWRESIELIPAKHGKEGNSCVKNFLIDLNNLPDREKEVIGLLKKYDFKEYRIEVEDKKWLLKESSYTEGKKKEWSKGIVIVDTNKGKGSGITEFLNDYASVKSKSCPVNYILLSLASKFPGDYEPGDYENENENRSWKLSESVDGKIVFECNWHVFYYSDYYKSIRTHFKISDDSTDLNGLIIQDYCRFLESLTSLVDVWQKDYDDCIKPFLSEGNGSYTRAKEHRIHDLYQKLKFSYLCAGLFNTIKDNYKNRYTVYPSNQSGLFKEKKDSPFEAGKDYICVNYTYLHGAPLLEINIHPKCDLGKEVELYYAIQVQGNAYEKGIQVKKNEVAERKLNHSRDANFSTTIWDSLKKNTIELKVKNWMDINTTKEKPFNKYDMSDGSYIYQKEILKDDITINEVIERMLYDLGEVVENTWNL